MPNYWVVGAMWEGGHEDQMDSFLRRGYWELGWKEPDAPEAQITRRDQIQAGDRIAVKKMLGRGSSEIEIRALGIVREVAPDDKRVYVDWVVTRMNRRVHAHGCLASIHGPFPAADAWTREVFQI